MTFRRALGYAAALPVSAVAAAILPFVAATGGRVHLRDGVIEAEGGILHPLLTRGIPRFPIDAITFGHVVLASNGRSLAESRAHERVHVTQYERLGVLFPFIYLAASLLARIRGGCAYRDNVFEREACVRSARANAVA